MKQDLNLSYFLQQWAGMTKGLLLKAPPRLSCKCFFNAEAYIPPGVFADKADNAIEIVSRINFKYYFTKIYVNQLHNEKAQS